MKISMPLIIYLFLLLLGSNNSAYCSSTQVDSSGVDSTLQQMTLDEKIGQLFMIAAYSNQSKEYEMNLEKQIQKFHIGGLIFFQGDPIRQARLTTRYQKASKYPLWIGLDAEHGVGWRLKSAMVFPKMAIIGAMRNDSLVYALGATIAKHCRVLGVHINFAPVVDINSNPDNPVIGIRAFSEDPEEVAQKAILYMKGSLSQNVLAVAKHFPGHGDTDTDSHYTLPYIPHTRDRIENIEFYPYKALIEASAPAIMTSHLNVPALDSSGMPATLSPIIINGILRKELKFKGLCITDAMNMKGVTKIAPPGEAEVKALLAGNDILLFPENPEKAVLAIKKAIADSLISEDFINEKCYKILVAKQTYALPNLYPIETSELLLQLNTPEDISLKQSIYKEAITLVKNKDSLIPLKHLDTLKIASLNFGNSKVNNFQQTLSRYTNVKHFTSKANLKAEEINTLIKQFKPYNCIIIYNHAGNNSSGKKFGHSNSLANLIKRLTGKRVILCQAAMPYGLQGYINLPIDAILVSYENQIDAQQYAAQGIFGGIAINGHIPVSISTEYPVGTGIRTKKTRLGYETPETCHISSSKLLQIDSICSAAIKDKATPGCQVLIAKNGSIIYNKAFGFHSYEKTTANKTDDIYDIASISKITATLPAIMKLYDKGQICLNKPLSTYYTALEDTDKKEMTTEEILCHNAGLKSFIPLFTYAVDKKSISDPLFTTKRTSNNTLRLDSRLYTNTNYNFKDSTLSSRSRKGYIHLSSGLYIYPNYRDTIIQTILHSPIDTLKNYAYSDLGFIFLKYAAEEVSGKGIDTFCQESFFYKLGMSSTNFLANQRLPVAKIVPSCYDQVFRKTEIKGCVHDPTAVLLGGIAGHAGLFSTAEDLAKILQMYLNKGNYGDETYLSPQTIEKFTSRNSLFPENRRGLGFDKPESDSTKTNPVCEYSPLSSYGHSGFTGTMAWCDPENDLIYIFLSNRTYPNEFNNKLSKENIRTKIQEVIYQSLN